MKQFITNSMINIASTFIFAFACSRIAAGVAKKVLLGAAGAKKSCGSAALEVWSFENWSLS
jgi:hypothetical protein